MDIANFTFSYDPSLINLAKINIFMWDGSNTNLLLISMIILIAYLLFYISFPYIYWFYDIRKSENRKLKNKNTIRELILMKEIQSELEKEMEQSLLNASLNSSN